MTIQLAAYANGDDVHLVWDPGAKIPKCLGFAIECRRPGKEPKAISNRVGFASDAPKDGETRSSREWPFQRFDWTDHAADLGDEIAYRVIARVLEGEDLVDGPTSEWTPKIKLSPDCGDGCEAHFNRGFVLSQFVARYMKRKRLTLGELKKRAADIDDEARVFLSGTLREAMLALLSEVEKAPTKHLFAALYELDDVELIGALCDIGERAHVVLANGSVAAEGDDQNKSARRKLKQAGVKVSNRMVSPKALGHNKFMVIGRGNEDDFKPQKVWTGSTNWTETGLCTQLNNGILIDNTKIAETYFEQWKHLRDAQSEFPKALVDANCEPTKGVKLATKAKADVWFSRTRDQVDIDELTDLVKAAREGILFVMFMPGTEPLKTLLDRQQKGFFVRGVATQFTGEGKEEVKLLREDPKNYYLDAIEADGVGRSVGKWAVEGTAALFKSQVGYAITHAKVFCIDPFSANPIVVTGSHNFSSSASKKNDENFIIIRGAKKLAEAYAVNCMMTYNHYRWRAYLAESKREGRTPWSFLEESPDWQSRRTAKPTREMLKFWLP